MRIAEISRNTLETQISVTINLDGTGIAKFNTGLPFLDHMLDQIARHGMMDITVEAVGDLHIDAHHTVEDMVMLMCPWMKHCHAWCWIYQVVLAWSFLSNLPGHISVILMSI
jgi:imidazoleglycerol phosphate dehydratase HisB